MRVLLVVMLLLCGCVTTILEPEVQTEAIESASILVSGTERADLGGASDVYYLNVLSQAREAYKEGDIQRLSQLLVAHDRADAPDWASQQWAAFRVAARGLWFEQEVLGRGQIRVENDPLPPIGGPLVFSIRVQGRADTPIWLGGRGSLPMLNVHISFELVDTDAYGTRTVRSGREILQPERDVLLHEAPLELTFQIEAPPGTSCLREIHVMAEVLPGQVTIDDEITPLRRAVCGRKTIVQYPQGIEAIQQAALKSLEAALQVGEPAYFPHVYLAAHFLAARKKTDPEPGIAAQHLLRVVRLGEQSQMRSATAALQVLTAEPIAIGDRDGWLAYGSRIQR